MDVASLENSAGFAERERSIMLAGKWTYRAFKNDWQVVGDNAAAALALISSEGVLDFDEAQDGRFRGALGMAPGYALVLSGEVDVASGAPPGFTIHGNGIEGTPTEGWRYEYRGVFGYSWPEAVDQLPSLVGTVMRVAAHGPLNPAGYTASFIAVRRRESDRPPRLRRSSLTVGL
jgi:hypothetical protein